ncbi:MAG: hypothetical protein KC418_05730 [Anaerolineales bacterium]|nr:hypothetical protein [Anaerolineales bacterium]
MRSQDSPLDERLATIQEVLIGYFENYDVATSKYQIQLILSKHMLATLITGQKRGKPKAHSLPLPLQLPNSMKQSKSGKILIWTIAQSAANDACSSELDIPFAIGNVTEEEANYLAMAYALWPQNPLVASHESQQTLFSWLGKYQSTSGWLASAFAKMENKELVAQALQKWQHGPIELTHFEFLIEFLLKATSTDRELHSMVKATLRRVSLTQTGSNDFLFTLCRIAFRQKCYLEAAKIGAIILSSRHATPIAAEIDAIQIASCAAMTQDELTTSTLSLEKWRQCAINGYANRWLQADTPFPYPDLLLPAFDNLATLPHRQHLLMNLRSDLPADTLAWLALERENEQGKWRETIEPWQALLLRHGNLHFLIRLTIALYESRLPVQENPIAQATLRYWKALLEDDFIDSYVAHAGIFLLQETDNPEWLPYYENNLADVPIDKHLLLAYAAESFIHHLFAYADIGWQEPVQKFFQRPDITLLRSKWLEEEYLYYKVFADLFHYQEKGFGRKWWETWERLLLLKLEINQVVKAIEYFTKYRTQYRTFVPDNLAQDIEIQIELWGRQEAERLLLTVSDAQKDAYQKRLRESTLDSLFIILQDIKLLTYTRRQNAAR